MLNPLSDLFKPVDQKQLEQELREAENSIKIAGDVARKCLTHQDFKLYRDYYKRAEENVLDAMISYTNSFFLNDTGDISKYAMKMMRFMTKLQDLRSLLDTIDKNSKKGLKE